MGVRGSHSEVLAMAPGTEECSMSIESIEQRLEMYQPSTKPRHGRTDQPSRSASRIALAKDPGTWHVSRRRQWDRHLDRIRKCKEGWNVLWLAAATAFFRRGGDGVVHRDFDSPRPYTQVDSSIWASGSKELFVPYCRILRTAFLGVVRSEYLTRRKDRDGEIEEIIKDMRVYEPEAPPPPPPPLPPIRQRSTHLSQDRQGPIPGESVEKGA